MYSGGVWYWHIHQPQFTHSLKVLQTLLRDGLEAAVPGSAESVGVHWIQLSESGDADVGTIWSKWSVIHTPVDGRELIEHFRVMASLLLMATSTWGEVDRNFGGIV